MSVYFTFSAVPHIVIEGEQPRLVQQSSTSFEISEITEKMTPKAQTESAKLQYLPLSEVRF